MMRGDRIKSILKFMITLFIIPKDTS